MPWQVLSLFRELLLELAAAAAGESALGRCCFFFLAQALSSSEICFGWSQRHASRVQAGPPLILWRMYVPHPFEGGVDGRLLPNWLTEPALVERRRDESLEAPLPLLRESRPGALPLALALPEAFAFAFASDLPSRVALFACGLAFR